jgi:hypothetical protein
MEPLNLNNVIEVQEIRELISNKENLIEFFDELIKKINKNINVEKHIHNIKIEDVDNDLLLSDHSSDDE